LSLAGAAYVPARAGMDAEPASVKGPGIRGRDRQHQRRQERAPHAVRNRSDAAGDQRGHGVDPEDARLTINRR